jgi:hypothetical protein
MDMSNLSFEITKLLRFLGDDPVALLHCLAYASGITLIIAVLTDSLLKKGAAHERKTAGERPKPQSNSALPRLVRQKQRRRDTPFNRT